MRPGNNSFWIYGNLISGFKSLCVEEDHILPGGTASFLPTSPHNLAVSSGRFFRQLALGFRLKTNTEVSILRIRNKSNKVI